MKAVLEPELPRSDTLLGLGWVRVPEVEWVGEGFVVTGGHKGLELGELASVMKQNALK